MSVCALSEGECGNPYPFFPPHPHLSCAPLHRCSLVSSRCAHLIIPSCTHRWLKERLHRNMSHMVAEPPFRFTEFLVDEWNLLSVILKNAVDSRRAAWRVITSIEQNDTYTHAREYIAEVEGELQKIRDGILALMDKNLIPSASTDESKVLYYKMKSDYYRYLAECATDDAKGKASEDTCAAYAEATKIAEKDLVVTHPVRLAMALSSVVAQRQIRNDQTVQRTVETPQLQRIDRVSDGLVVQVEHVPQSHVFIFHVFIESFSSFFHFSSPSSPLSSLTLLPTPHRHGRASQFFSSAWGWVRFALWTPGTCLRREQA